MRFPMMLLGLAAATMAHGRDAPRKGAHAVAKAVVAKPHAISVTGVLNEADLAAIAQLGAASLQDQFSDNPSLAYVGRDYSVLLPASEIGVDYDRDSHVLTAIVSKYSDIITLSRKLDSSVYAGKNGFGAKASVSKLRGATFGIWLPGSIYNRKPLTYTSTIAGDAARSLSTDIRARLTGKVIKADGVYAEKASAIMRKSLVTDATVASPMDTLIDQYGVAISVEKVDWLNARTGLPLTAGE